MSDVPQDDFDEITHWHFAVGGIDTQQEVLELGGPFLLRRLKQFPTHEDLALSLTSLPVAGAMALYGEKIIQHELVIDAERFEDNLEQIFPTAEAILAGLRICTSTEIVCPAVCERSWDDLESTPPNQCRAYHFERGLSHKLAVEPHLVLPEDMDWLRNNLGTIVELTEHEGFQTAVEALCTYMLAANDRMKAAQLWAGVEALFGRRLGEVGYRLRIMTALLVEENGLERRKHFKRFKKLYNTRSNAVHGGKLKTEELMSHLGEVRDLLARLLSKVVAIGKVPNDDDFEEMLFEHKLGQSEL
ncbi:MAG: hypothetical protein ACFCD0_27325 [Gemmataceae bacterium]